MTCGQENHKAKDCHEKPIDVSYAWKMSTLQTTTRVAPRVVCFWKRRTETAYKLSELKLNSMYAEDY